MQKTKTAEEMRLMLQVDAVPLREQQRLCAQGLMNFWDTNKKYYDEREKDIYKNIKRKELHRWKVIKSA